MEIVLISDGSLPLESPLRKLPFFFPARLIDMAKVSPGTVGEAGVAIVELLDATDAGLKALKDNWASIASTSVICIVSKANRRECIQASALGKSEQLDRDIPFSLLLKRVKSCAGANAGNQLPTNTLESISRAFLKADSFLETLCLTVATDTNVQIKAMNDSASELLEALDLDGLHAWLEAVQFHHSGTYGHSLAVAGLAGAFARHLGWKKEDCCEVVAGGLVHDIGKMRIPLTILDKPGALSDKERELVDKHPVFGQEILRPRLEVPVDVKKMAIQHHEFLDGSGYPNGLKGDRINAKVRLITICDIYCALTEERSYREGDRPRVAISKLKEMGGKLDQAMVQKFEAMVLGRGFGDVARAGAASESNRAAAG